jgi:hypothetical protein
MYPDTGIFIDGTWGPAADRRAIPVQNPATGEAIGEVAHAGRDDLDRALAAAERGFTVWRKVSAYERAKVMRRAAALLRERLEAVARIMTTEQGKPLAEARAEIGVGADVIEWFAEEARRAYGRVVPARAEGVYQLVIKEPVGRLPRLRHGTSRLTRQCARFPRHWRPVARSSSRAPRKRQLLARNLCVCSSTLACPPARLIWSSACRPRSLNISFHIRLSARSLSPVRRRSASIWRRWRGDP